jgi:hypothetical protein
MGLEVRSQQPDHRAAKASANPILTLSIHRRRATLKPDNQIYEAKNVGQPEKWSRIKQWQG